MQGYCELLTSRDLQEAAALLRALGLELPEGTHFGLGYYEDGVLLATGFLAGQVLCGIATSPALQGNGVASGLVSRLVQQAAVQGQHALMLFTKPAEAAKFQALGFALVAMGGSAALLEFGQPDCAAWLAATQERIRTLRQGSGGNTPSAPPPPHQAVGAIVMNANPCTRGHVHLVQQALLHCPTVYVFVVEAEASVFPFAQRLRLVRESLADLPGAFVLPAGPYMVSQASFPAYFTGLANHAATHADLDCTLFATRIAGPLGIQARFVGSEPYCPVTAVYNTTLHAVLPRHGINCRELPRLEAGGQPVSASRVRRLFAQADSPGDAWPEIATLVPEPTLAFLRSPQALPIRDALRAKVTRH